MPASSFYISISYQLSVNGNSLTKRQRKIFLTIKMLVVCISTGCILMRKSLSPIGPRDNSAALLYIKIVKIFRITVLGLVNKTMRQTCGTDFPLNCGSTMHIVQATFY